MNHLKNPQNLLYLGVIVIVFILFGSNLLSIGINTSTDFTHTNTEVSGSNIQLSMTPSTIGKTYVNPRWSDISSSPYYSVSDSYVPLSTDALCVSYLQTCYAVSEFCIAASGGDSSYSDLTSTAYDGERIFYYTTVEWAGRDLGSDYKYATSITCDGVIIPSTTYYTTGNLIQTTEYTTTEQYDTLTLVYNETLNSGTITPYLVIDGVQQSLTNKELTGTFPVGTTIKIEFDFTGSTTVTPQLENNIVLSGSYTAQVVDSENSLSEPVLLQVISLDDTIFSQVPNKVQIWFTNLFNKLRGIFTK